MIFWFVLLLLAIAMARFIRGSSAKSETKTKLRQVQKRLEHLEAHAENIEKTEGGNTAAKVIRRTRSGRRHK